MSDYREGCLKHKELRDDRSVEPSVRLGTKPKKPKPWTVAYIHSFSIKHHAWRRDYSKLADALQVLRRNQSKIFYSNTCMETFPKQHGKLTTGNSSLQSHKHTAPPH